MVAVDTDLEGANLHTWLGVSEPPVSLADFVAGREGDPAKLVIQTPVEGVGLIAATQGHLQAAQPGASGRASLLRALRGIATDVVLLDCGAGAHAAGIDYFLAAEDGIVVLHPEPTSVENAYAFLRAAFYRRMEHAMHREETRQRIREAMDQRNERGIRTPLDLMREVEAIDPEEGERFARAVRRLQPRLVVNEVSSAEDVRLGFAVRSVCRRYFGLEADYAGYVNRDASVRESVHQRRPVLKTHPDCDASVYVRRIAKRLMQDAGLVAPPAKRPT